jgi:hypothetical protein
LALFYSTGEDRRKMVIEEVMRTPTMGILTALVFLIIGVGGLVWPEKIQEFALKYYADHPSIARLNPFLDWMRTRSYIVSVRIVGFLSISASILVLFATIRGIDK